MTDRMVVAEYSDAFKMLSSIPGSQKAGLACLLCQATSRRPDIQKRDCRGVF